MAFVNAYLTDEEKKMFAQRAIPTGLWWSDRILGVDPYSKVWCTLDRDANIYLFDFGRFHDAENLDEHNFRLIWDTLAGNEAIHIIVRKDLPPLSTTNNESTIVWHSLELGLPKNIKHEKEAVIVKFKEALTAFGINGNPASSLGHKVIFDF